MAIRVTMFSCIEYIFCVCSFVLCRPFLANKVFNQKSLFLFLFLLTDRKPYLSRQLELCACTLSFDAFVWMCFFYLLFRLLVDMAHILYNNSNDNHHMNTDHHTHNTNKPTNNNTFLRATIVIVSTLLGFAPIKLAHSFSANSSFEMRAKKIKSNDPSIFECYRLILNGYAYLS